MLASGLAAVREPLFRLTAYPSDQLTTDVIAENRTKTTSPS